MRYTFPFAGMFSVHGTHPRTDGPRTCAVDEAKSTTHLASDDCIGTEQPGDKVQGVEAQEGT